MGKFKMRSSFLSIKLKQTKVRLLIIDDNQIRYNQIVQILVGKGHLVDAFLLDDLKSFEKQLQTDWDIVLFGRAYDLKVEQAATLIHASSQPDTPLLLLNPENYEPTQYLSYINKGIYDLFNLDYPERFYIGLLRTLSYSRAIQTQKQLSKELELVDAQIKIQTQENHKAVALIQEGIHLEANQEYLDLFGLKQEDDIIGLPLLDILQPEDTNTFKQRFKKISQQNFDQARFDILSLNPNFSEHKTLKLEFFPSADEGVQLAIDTNTATETVVKHYYEPLNRKLTNDPAHVNALIVFKLQPFDELVQNLDQKTTTLYLENVQKFIEEQMHNIAIKLTPSTYISLCQSSNNDLLGSKIMGLYPLTKPQLLDVNGTNYPLQFNIGSCPLVGNIQNQEEFDFLFSQALASPIQPKEIIQETALDFSIEEPEPIIEPEPIVNKTQHIELTQRDYILTALEQNTIHLKYQQLYDKQDTNLYTYEVTSGIIHNNSWLELCDSEDLEQDQELSAKVDRWILVEACKQLNNFVIQYPNAKLLLNLNNAIIQDPQFVNLITKLLSIMSNAHKNALILQFNIHAINQSFAQIFEALKLQHVAISLRHFGTQTHHVELLQTLKPNLCYLDISLTKMLNTDKTLSELQEKIKTYQEAYSADLILPKLDDMTTFANAWNVDARYLQGDYFQKKLDHLIDH